MSVAMAVWLFGVPLRGSLLLLFLSSALFLIAALGMGLTISTAARNQFVAGQIAIVATFLPAFMLSGFIFDINSMPTVIQYLTYAIPLRYFLIIVRSVFLEGATADLLIPQYWPMLVIGCGCLIMASFLFRRRIS